MIDEKLVNQQLLELNRQYEQVTKQIASIDKAMDDLAQFASNLMKSQDFDVKPIRMSNVAWQQRILEFANELIRVDRKHYPTQPSVLKAVYIRLRNEYGIVLDQLRRDYRYKYDILRSPTALEAISDNDRIRSIFESVLKGLFPEDYFEDDILVMIENGEENDKGHNKEDAVWKIIVPLATKRNDNSFGYTQTLEAVCKEMDCVWSNLQTRYKKKHGLDQDPAKIEIITENPYVMRKFKKTVSKMLANC